MKEWRLLLGALVCALLGACSSSAVPQTGSATHPSIAAARAACARVRGARCRLVTGAVAQQVLLSQQAVQLNNPTTPGSTTSPQTFKLYATLLDSDGDIITGTYEHALHVDVWQPTTRVITPGAQTITASGQPITLTYSGAYFQNPMTLALYSAGTGDPWQASATGEIVGKNVVGNMNQTACAPYSSDRVAIRVPNAGDKNVRDGWHLRYAFINGGLNGPTGRILIDTGSRGIVVSQSALAGSGAIGPGAPGEQRYTSSGVLLKGYYYLTRVAINPDRASNSAITVPMEVLAVPNSGVAMMGVGFGRYQIGTTASGPPSNNAFLQLRDVVEGKMQPGYVIKRDTIELGMTAANTAGFSMETLQRDPSNPGDWVTAAGCYGFPDVPGYGSICGTLLVDTGLRSMFVSLPQALRPPAYASGIPNGTRMSIAAPNGTNPAMQYGFRVGGGAPAPSSVTWVDSNGSTPFVNTGRNVMSRFNYLFDAGCGRVGFKPSR